MGFYLNKISLESTLCKYMAPYFGTNLPTKVVKRLGDTAFLKCKVFNLGNKMVSWIRTDPLEIISSGLYTFIGDSRYSTEYLSEDNVWVLRITNVRYEDMQHSIVK